MKYLTRALFAAAAVLAAVTSSGAAGPVPNRAPLGPTPLVPLPVGDVRAAGWLLTELQLARDGLTGHAEQVIPELDRQPAPRWRLRAGQERRLVAADGDGLRAPPVRRGDR